MGRKLTTQEFIDKAKLIHGDLYDYSLVNYQGSTFQVDIICKIHGVFPQNSHDHLCGKGCKECGKIKGHNKDTKEIFVKKANLAHNNFYDYTKTVYVESKKDVTITCPIHGDFKQKATDHLQGKGCRKCGIIKNSLSRTLPASLFIKRANKVHSSYYDYSNMNYVNTEININIICPIHGEFPQTPRKHLIGQGCPKCVYKNQSKLFGNLQEDFKETILYEYSPEWLGTQRFDMYFLDHNIAVEYNGLQHDIAIKHFGGELGLEKTIERDELKRDKCMKNNCRLFEMKYNYNEDDYVKLVNDIELIIKSKTNEN